MPRLTRPAFRAFLAAKKPNHRFTKKADMLWAQCCPLSAFLGTDVGRCTYDDGAKDLPKWAMVFVDAVDDATGDIPSITAKRALAVLDSLK